MAADLTPEQVVYVVDLIDRYSRDLAGLRRYLDDPESRWCCPLCFEVLCDSDCDMAAVRENDGPPSRTG